MHKNEKTWTGIFWAVVCGIGVVAVAAGVRGDRAPGRRPEPPPWERDTGGRGTILAPLEGGTSYREAYDAASARAPSTDDGSVTEESDGGRLGAVLTGARRELRVGQTEAGYVALLGPELDVVVVVRAVPPFAGGDANRAHRVQFTRVALPYAPTSTGYTDVMAFAVVRAAERFGDAAVTAAATKRISTEMRAARWR